jgi:uncharacterized protein YuzE
MNIAYDSEHRSLYLKLRAGDAVESTEVAAGIVLDLDAQGLVVGIDLDDVDQPMGLPIDSMRSA